MNFEVPSRWQVKKRAGSLNGHFGCMCRYPVCHCHGNDVAGRPHQRHNRPIFGASLGARKTQRPLERGARCGLRAVTISSLNSPSTISDIYTATGPWAVKANAFPLPRFFVCPPPQLKSRRKPEFFFFFPFLIRSTWTWWQINVNQRVERRRESAVSMGDFEDQKDLRGRKGSSD